MNRIILNGIILTLGALSAWAQTAPGASAAGSSAATLGWSLAGVGIIAALVVIARRLSMGQAWKFEIPVLALGLLMLVFGLWQVNKQQIDVLLAENAGLQNRVTAAQRQAEELRAVSDQLHQKVTQWQMRDQEWQKLQQDWTTYANSLKQRLDAITAARAARTTTAGSGSKSGKTTGKSTTTKPGTTAKPPQKKKSTAQ